jgi:hypothetical protein
VFHALIALELLDLSRDPNGLPGLNAERVSVGRVHEIPDFVLIRTVGMQSSCRIVQFITAEVKFDSEGLTEVVNAFLRH